MDKKDLLKSFSKVHNRSLSLLEQEVDPAAQTAAAAAEQTGKNQTFGQAVDNPITRPNGKPIYVWTPASGKKEGITLFSTKANSFGAKAINDHRDEFVNAFKLDTQDTATPTGVTKDERKERDSANRVKRNEELLNSEFGKNNKDITNEIIKNTTEFEETLDNAICDENDDAVEGYMEIMRREGQGEEESSKCIQQLQFIRGSRIGNVEKQITNKTPSIKLIDGEYKIVEKPADPMQSLEVSKALVTLAKAAGGDVEAKEEACKKFKVTEGGGLKGVAVFTEEGSAKVFNNAQTRRALMGLLNVAGCEEALRPQAISKIETAAGESVPKQNIARGEAGELAQVAATDLNNYRSLKESNATPEQLQAAQELVIDSAQKVVKELRKLNRVRETWIERAQESIVSEEQQAEVEVLSEVLGTPEKERELLTAILAMGRVAGQIRKPLVTIQVAEQVGLGNKQDTLELYGSKEEALSAIRKTEAYLDDGEQQSRVREEDIIETTASAAFACKPNVEVCPKSQLLDKYIKAGYIKSKDQPLYGTEFSLKTLLRLEAAKLGETTPQSVEDGLSEKNLKDGEPDPRSQNFYKKIVDFKARVKTLSEKAAKLRENVNKLSTKTKIKRADGGEITQNTLETYSDSVIKEIQTNNKYKDIRDDVDLEKLRAYIKQMSTTDLTDEAFEKAVKDHLYKTVLFSRTNKQAQEVKKSGEPTERAKAAQLLILGMLNQAGGSSRDNTIFEVSDLETLTTYTSTQNSEINSVIDSIVEGKNEWEPSYKGGSFSFRRKGNSNRSISLTLKGGKWIAMRSARSLKDASTASRVNNPSESGSENSSTMVKVLGRIQEALSFISEKVGIINVD